MLRPHIVKWCNRFLLGILYQAFVLYCIQTYCGDPLKAPNCSGITCHVTRFKTRLRICSMCLCLHAATYHSGGSWLLLSPECLLVTRNSSSCCQLAVRCGVMGLWWACAGQMDDAFEVMIALYEEVATVAKAAGDPKIIHESCGLVVLVGQCTPICIEICMANCYNSTCCARWAAWCGYVRTLRAKPVYMVENGLVCIAFNCLHHGCTSLYAAVCDECPWSRLTATTEAFQHCRCLSSMC